LQRRRTARQTAKAAADRAHKSIKSKQHAAASGDADDLSHLVAGEDEDGKWAAPEESLTIEFLKTNSIRRADGSQYPLDVTAGRHCSRGGCGAQCDYWQEGQTSDLGILGPGVTNYFKFSEFWPSHRAPPPLPADRLSQRDSSVISSAPPRAAQFRRPVKTTGADWASAKWARTKTFQEFRFSALSIR